jgi:hypothetical protein
MQPVVLAKRLTALGCLLGVAAAWASACTNFGGDSPSSTQPNAPPGGEQPGYIRCNDVDACAPHTVCCLLASSHADGCAANGTACKALSGGSDETFIACDNAGDCLSGEICCGHPAIPTRLAQARCATPEGCTDLELCEPGSEGECRNGGKCARVGESQYGKCVPP